MDTYYRPPSFSTPVDLRTARPGRRPRYHRGARLGDRILVARACNIAQTAVIEVDDLERLTALDSQICRRCYPPIYEGHA